VAHKAEQAIRVLTLLFAAVIAIGGTIITGFVQGDYKSRLTAAQLRYEDIQHDMTASEQLVQRAYLFQQHAIILTRVSRNDAGWNGRASRYAFDAVDKMWARLDKGDAIVLAELKTKCGAPTFGSVVYQSVDAANCLYGLAIADMKEEKRTIEYLDGRINLLGTLATVLQLLGIGIAFAKDLLF
jgi:hypothetical protein